MGSVLFGSFPKSTTPSFPYAVAADLSSSLATGVHRDIHFHGGGQVKWLQSCNRLHAMKKFQLQKFYTIHHLNGFEGRQRFSLYQIQSPNDQPNSGSIDPPASTDDVHPESPIKSLQRMYDAFYKFLRPYAALGTVVSIFSYSLLAVEKFSDFTPVFVMKTLETLLAACLMHIYVGGYNQIADIEIDKVNKPYLPLASGELSYGVGVAIVSLSSIMSFLIAWKTSSRPLFWALSSWCVLGTAYSIDLPFLRWKKYPLMAALYVMAERALVVPVAFIVHAQTYINGRAVVISKHAVFAALMMTLFSLVLAFFKDIPDIEGDMKYGIKSLAARLGPKQMFWSCIWFLEMVYGIAILIGLSSSNIQSRYATVLGHAIMALILWIYAKSVDVKSKEAILKCYTFIWKLFYVEFLLMPLVR